MTCFTSSVFLRAAFAIAVAVTFTANTASAQSGSVSLEHSKIYVFVGKKGAGHEHGV